MGVPRQDRSARTALVEHEGKTYAVKYVPLCMRESDECGDEATVVSLKGTKLNPFLYSQLRMRRMVTEIDGEPIDKDSAVWYEVPEGFGLALRKALLPGEDETFRAEPAEGALGDAAGG